MDMPSRKSIGPTDRLRESVDTYMVTIQRALRRAETNPALTQYRQSLLKCLEMAKHMHDMIEDCESQSQLPSMLFESAMTCPKCGSDDILAGTDKTPTKCAKCGKTIDKDDAQKDVIVGCAKPFTERIEKALKSVCK